MSAKVDARFTGSIAATPEYVEALGNMCHNSATLAMCHYQLEASPSARIEAKLKCTKCLARIWDRSAAPAREILPQQSTQIVLDMDTNIYSEVVVSTKPYPICCYHDGRKVYDKKSSERVWTCCGKPGKGLGCVEKTSHTIPPPNDPELSEYWRFYHTPAVIGSQPPNTAKKGRKAKKGISLAEFENLNRYHRKAVALDCEMGTSRNHWPEMIRIGVVDYFTGATLIDKLVKPSMPMQNMNTDYGSGVTWDDLNAAVRDRTCFFGAAAVREELFKFVGPETIVVTHAGHNDLNVIRWIHPRIADTQIFHTSRRAAALADLAAEYCGTGIQNGAKGHCSVEDAMATREVMHAMVRRRMNAN